jgi:tRNA(Arg) A34 adenosine deaminase TadA
MATKFNASEAHDLALLRRAFDVARRAQAHGNHPFGAILVSGAVLGTATIYSSAEPCAMCAGAIYWSGIGRVVFGLSERRLRALTGDHAENPTLDLPCRTVFTAGQRTVSVSGPLIEDEAAALHAGAWDRPNASPKESR